MSIVEQQELIIRFFLNRTIGVDGRVNLNGVERNLKMFRKQSAYIEQYDHLLQNLTVGEYMNAAAHLKLGNGLSQVEKKSNVNLIFTLAELFKVQI